MNHLERLLCMSERKVKSQAKELILLTDQLKTLSEKVKELQKSNTILQAKIEQQMIIESEFKKENQFLETDRNNLLDQLKSQHEFILATTELQQKNIFNKMRVVQELNITRNELSSQSQELLKFTSQNAQLSSEVSQLKDENTQLNQKLQYFIQNEKQEKNKYEKLLQERDIILQELKERIQLIESHSQLHFTEEQMIELEEEQSQITEEDSKENCQIDMLKQKYDELQQMIVNLKSQIIEKEQQNIQLQTQIGQLQEQISQQKSYLTQNQIEKAMPIVLQQQLQQLRHLKMIFPQLIDKISRLEINQQEIFSLRNNLQNLQKDHQKLQADYSNLQKQNEETLKENKESLTSLQQVLQENWEIKQQLINYLSEEKAIEFCEQLSYQLNFEDYPFESLEELIQNHNKMRLILNKQSEQMHCKQI